MKPKLHTIFIAGSQGGGQLKSTTIASLADALHALGFSTEPIAIDSNSDCTLKKLLPDTRHFFPLHDGAEGAYQAAYGSTADIAIIDSPSGYAENLADPAFITSPDRLGARIVVGIIVDIQSEHSLECGLDFAKAFEPYTTEFIAMAVQPEWPTTGWQPNDPFLLKSPVWKNILELAKGKVIPFPAFSQFMLHDHQSRPAVPSVHIAQASNPISAVPWKSYHENVLESVAQHAEWLTGKSIPTATTPTPTTPTPATA